MLIWRGVGAFAVVRFFNRFTYHTNRRTPRHIFHVHRRTSFEVVRGGILRQMLFLYDANVSPNSEGAHSGTLRASQSFVYRELTERVIIVIVNGFSSLRIKKKQTKLNAKRQQEQTRSNKKCKGNVSCTSYSRTFGYGKLRTSSRTNMNNLEHIANNGTDTTKHTDVYNAQF